MKNTFLFTLFSATLLLSACTDIESSIPFESTYGSRFVNLKRAIYKDFIVNDSLIYEVRYDRKLKLNTVRSYPDMDTIFQAHVSKHNDYWICSEPQSEGGFKIWGFKKEDEQITGWSERNKTSFILHNNSLTEVGKSALDSSLLIMDEPFIEANIEKLLAQYEPIPVERYTYDKGEEEELIETDTPVSERLIHQLYPVPVKTSLSLELIDEGNYTAVIYNLKGQQVFEESFSGDLVEFNLEHLENGKHILALLNNLGVVVDQESIYISH